MSSALHTCNMHLVPALLLVRALGTELSHVISENLSPLPQKVTSVCSASAQRRDKVVPKLPSVRWWGWMGGIEGEKNGLRKKRGEQLLSKLSFPKYDGLGAQGKKDLVITMSCASEGTEITLLCVWQCFGPQTSL